MKYCQWESFSSYNLKCSDYIPNKTIVIFEVQMSLKGTILEKLLYSRHTFLV